MTASRRFAALRTAIRLVLCGCAVCCGFCGGQVKADFQFGGTEPSLEWLVDASHVVALAEIVDLPDQKQACRVTEVLKEADAGKVKVQVGDTLAREVHLGAGWKAGDRTVVFFTWKKDLDLPVTFGPRDGGPRGDPVPSHVISLVRPQQEGSDENIKYLVLDKYGKIILNPDKLIATIKHRVAEGRKDSPTGAPRVCDAGFAYPHSDIDSSESYYYTYSPPDPCFKEDLEKAARSPEQGYGSISAIEAQSLLFHYYPRKTEQELRAAQDDTLKQILEIGKTLHARGKKHFSFANYCTFPGCWVAISPDGDLLAMLAGDTLALRDVRTGKAVYEGAGCYRHYDLGQAMIFSPQAKRFAHLHANGDVSVYSLQRNKVELRGLLPWKPKSSMFFEEFTFSPDGRCVVLQMHSGEGGRGNALAVWDIESGERILTLFDNWRSTCRLEGFSGDSKLLSVVKNDLVKQTWNLRTGRREYAADRWQIPNPRRRQWQASNSRDKSIVIAKIEVLSHDGAKKAQLLPGDPQRLLIESAQGAQPIKSVELPGSPLVKSLFFSGNDALVFLVFFARERGPAWVFTAGAQEQWPASVWWPQEDGGGQEGAKGDKAE